jgi:hypothetical protein
VENEDVKCRKAEVAMLVVVLMLRHPAPIRDTAIAGNTRQPQRASSIRSSAFTSNACPEPI